MSSRPKISHLSRDEQESIAENVHKISQFGDTFPFEIEFYLSEELGYDICPTPSLEETCNVDTALVACKKLIRIQTSTYMDKPERARMSLAHEAAHLLLHREYIEFVCGLLKKANKTDDYQRIILSLPSIEASRAEEQAFYTAGALMAPRDVLRKQIVVYIEKHCEIGKKLPESEIENVMRSLSTYFGITKAAVVKRIQHTKLWWILDTPRQDKYSDF